MKNNMKNFNKMRDSFSFFKVGIYIMVLLASMDIFTYYFTAYLKGEAFYAILIGSGFLAILNSKNLKVSNLHSKQIIFFTIWVFIYIIENQFFANYGYSNIKVGIDFNVFTLRTIQVICVFITYFYLDSIKSDKIKVNIIKSIFFSLVVDAVITLRALNIDPNISKIMATGNADLNINNLKGVSGYSIIYSIVIIMPLLYVGIKECRAKSRVIMLSFIMLMMFFIYKAAYATALIALVLGIIVYLFLNTSNRIKVFLVPISIFFATILINPNIVYDILMYLSDKIDTYQVAERFTQLASLVRYGDDSGDTLFRSVLYRQSIDAFLKYPITGIIIFKPNYALSGHSAFLDILGGSGLIGFVPYVLFIWYSFKISLKKAEDRKFKNAIRTSYVVFCFIGSINTLSTSFSIMFFLLFFINCYPAFINYIKTKQIKNKKDIYITGDVLE